MLIYLFLAVVSSALLALGLLMMKSRGRALPAASGMGILASVCAWLRDPVWLGGLGVQTAGYAVYVIAVAGAPVSMVAVMSQGGIALFVIMAVIFLGERAQPWEWAGIFTIVAAMVLLSFSLSGEAPQGAMDIRSLITLGAGLAILSTAPFLSRRLILNGAAHAIGSGIAFGLGSLFTKALTDSFISAAGTSMVIRIAANPWLWATAVANIAGMVMLQNSFHNGRGIITMPLSSALSNLVPIAGGLIVFGERLPAQPMSAAMRLSAFTLTIIASAMLAAAQEAELEAVTVVAAPKAPG